MRAISGEIETLSSTRQSGTVIMYFARDFVNNADLKNIDNIITGKMLNVRKVYESGEDPDRDFIHDHPPAILVNILDCRTGDRTTGGFGWERMWVTCAPHHSSLEISWRTEGKDLQILKIGFLFVGL